MTQADDLLRICDRLKNEDFVLTQKKYTDISKSVERIEFAMIRQLQLVGELRKLLDYKARKDGVAI